MRLMLFGLAVLLVGTGWVLGQAYYAPPAPYYYDSRASTPAESYARGMSDVIRSQGQYNVATSEAAINMTQAQRQYIQNRDQWTNTFFQMREANRMYRDRARSPRPTTEQMVRWAQAGRPERLSPSELDMVSGRINWPLLLTADRYAKQRVELESLFAQRAAGAVTWENSTEIDQVTKAMLEELKGQVREVPQMDYIAAKRFLESLAHEAKLPPG